MMWGFIYNVVEIYPDFLPLECAIPYAPLFFFTILLFFKRQSQNNKIKSSLLEEMIFGQSRLLLFTFVLQMSNVKCQMLM